MTYISKKKITRKFKKTKLNLYNLNGGNIKQTKNFFMGNFNTIKYFLKLEKDKLDLDSIKFPFKNKTTGTENDKSAFNENLKIINEKEIEKDGIKQMVPNNSHITTLFEKIVSILTKKTDDFLINETNKDVIWLYNNLIDKVKFQGKENIKIYISKYIDLSINLYISIKNELEKMKGKNMKEESNERLDDTSQSPIENYDEFLVFYTEFLKTKSNTPVLLATNNTNAPNKLLENYNKFLELCIKFLFLTTQVSKFTPNPNGNPFYTSQVKQKENIQATKLDNFNTFLELDNFIDTNIDIIQKIKNTIENKKLIKECDNGKGIEIIVNTDNLYVYKVTSKGCAMKYGSGTDWCTASTNENMYEEYKDGLYILQPKDKIKDNDIFRVQKTDNKYQLHLGKNQLFDKTQKIKFTRKDIIEVFKGDEKLIRFLEEICSKFTDETNYTKYDKDKNSLDINRITTLCNENNEEFSLDLNNSLNSVNLRDIQTLTFGNDFNQPLGNILDSLTNLQTLTFGREFNNGKKINDPLNMEKPLDTSLYNLTNLQTLTFGEQFNQILGNSLDKLTNLQTLTFGHYFRNKNNQLTNELDKLTNLQTLTFGAEFNQKLGNSLDKLTNLQTLTFGESFTNFGWKLSDSLDTLTNLQTLNFGREFNIPLDNSLDKLTNLQTLRFVDEFGLGHFNKPLGNSLDSLINLQILIFSKNFNQPLGNSLNGLTNLQTLTFGELFNQPLGNSLDSLINLQTLTFGELFNQPLGNSLNGLTKLQTLTFGEQYKNSNFNQSLGNSLDSLTNLQTLIFSKNFNQPLDNSLDSLINLQTLTFGELFNQPLGNSLNRLTNLISIDLPYNHSENKKITVLIKKNIENIKKRENNWKRDGNTIRTTYTQKRLTNHQTQKNQNKVNKLKDIIAPYVIINNDKLPTEWDKTALYNNLNNNNNNKKNNNKKNNNKNNNKLKKQSINNMLTFLSDKKKQNQKNKINKSFV